MVKVCLIKEIDPVNGSNPLKRPSDLDNASTSSQSHSDTDPCETPLSSAPVTPATDHETSVSETDPSTKGFDQYKNADLQDPYIIPSNTLKPIATNSPPPHLPDPSSSPDDSSSLCLSDPDSSLTSPISQPPSPSPCHSDEFLPVSEIPPDIKIPQVPQHVDVPISSPLSTVPSSAISTPNMIMIDFEEGSHDFDACSAPCVTIPPSPPPPPHSTPPPPVPPSPNIATVTQLETVIDKAPALDTDPVDHGNDLESRSHVSTGNSKPLNTMVIPTNIKSVSSRDNVALDDLNFLLQASDIHTCHLSSFNFPDPLTSYGLHHGFTSLTLPHGPGPPLMTRC
ncbi:protein TRACHEARY ELEMENT DIFFERENTIATION-RELATED 7A-like [Lytechinus variegatus]|uniref:protein TRACHEARY ELEMENT DIFFERENTIATION-RELATED 7A-like n=1 Tax=Lytechinus variegatus TaxID=7654 RepID=UPI001BB2944C|nr:protein TRACHEARY ELEMENT DIFFERENTIATION-RELATED 7A-like [Lytechinus variegatus]